MDLNFLRMNKTDGPERRKGYGEALAYPPEEGSFGFTPFGQAAMKEGWITLLNFGDVPYAVTNHVTETKDNSSTIAGAAGGLALTWQASPSDDDDICFNSVRAVTAAANRRWRFIARFQKSSAANMGLRMGFLTSGGTEAFSAAPADGFYFASAKNSAALTFNVVENTNAAVATSSFVTALNGSAAAVSLVDATDIVLGIDIFLGTSTTTRGRVTINGFETNLAAASATALYTLLNTTAPTLVAHFGTRLNGTTQRSLTMQYAWAGVMRS